MDYLKQAIFVPIAFSMVQHCAIWAFEPQTPDPGQILAKAIEFHQSGAFEKAIEQYEEFLKSVPNVADVRSNLGAAYVQVGRFEAATDQYRRALELRNGTDPTAIRFNLALAYFKMFRLPEAIEELTRVLAEQPEHRNAAILLADCYLRSGDDEKVIELLSPFEKEETEDKALPYLLGTALIRLGEVDKGQVLVDRILRHGDSAEAHLMLGHAYMMVREVPSAVKEFERALELNPNLPSANAILAKTLREMGRVEESMPYFRKELELNPYDFDSLLYLGVHRYKHEQNYEEALSYFDRALKIRPGALEVRFQIGLVYVLQDRVDEALEIVEDVVREAPDFLEGHVTLTRLYYRLKRKEDAERHRAIVERLRAEKDAQTVKQVPPEVPEKLQDLG